MSEGQKTLFIICPLKSEDSPTRRRSDQLRRHIIDPAAKDKGYDVVRSDTLSEPGRIDKQIVDHLLDDDLVVCDLTEHNPNVLYELAIRHAIKKPVILLGEKDTRPPFDLYSQRVITYDLTNPDKVVESKDELIRQIEAIEKNEFIVDSPIRGTESIVMKGSKSTDINDAINEMMNVLRNITDRIRRIEDNMPSTQDKDLLSSKEFFISPIPATSLYDQIDNIRRLIDLSRICPQCSSRVFSDKCNNCGYQFPSKDDSKKT